VGVSQTAALNRGRHLYSAGRPSRWALAHIYSLYLKQHVYFVFFVEKVVKYPTGILYTFLGLSSPNGILPGSKFTLRPSLPFSYIGSVTARHSSSGRQPNFRRGTKMELRNFRSSSFSSEDATYILRASITLAHILSKILNLCVLRTRNNCQ